MLEWIEHVYSVLVYENNGEKIFRFNPSKDLVEEKKNNKYFLGYFNASTREFSITRNVDILNNISDFVDLGVQNPYFLVTKILEKENIKLEVNDVFNYLPVNIASAILTFLVGSNNHIPNPGITLDKMFSIVTKEISCSSLKGFEKYTVLDNDRYKILLYTNFNYPRLGDSKWILVAKHNHEWSIATPYAFRTLVSPNYNAEELIDKILGNETMTIWDLWKFLGGNYASDQDIDECTKQFGSECGGFLQVIEMEDGSRKLSVISEDAIVVEDSTRFKYCYKSDINKIEIIRL